MSQQQLQDYKQTQLFCQSEYHELWVWSNNTHVWEHLWLSAVLHLEPFCVWGSSTWACGKLQFIVDLKELRRDALKISKREVSFSSWGGLKSTSGLLRETSQPVVSQQTYFYVFVEEKFRFLFCFVTVLMISELLLKLVQSVSDHYSIYLIDLN